MSERLPHKASDLPVVDKNDLDTVCKQYSEYLEYTDLADYQMKQFAGDVENTLMRVDEFGSLVDSIRTDREKMLTQITPALIEKARELQRVYTLVDQLENFVRKVGRTVHQMEEQVSETGQAYTLVQRHRTINSFGLGTITSKYIPLKTAASMPDYTGIEPVNTEEFFTQWRKKAFDEKLYALGAPAKQDTSSDNTNP